MGLLEELEARPPVTKPVTIYMDTGAVTEVLELREDVRRVKGNELPGLKSEAAVHQRRLDEAEARMLASERVFRFKALSDAEYEALIDAYPSADERYAYDLDAFPVPMIAAASFDPVLTVDEAQRLQGLVTKYEWDQLFAAAFSVQVEKPRPFTGTGTGRTLGSGLNSITASTTA